MITADEIQKLIEEALPGASVEVRDPNHDGEHFEATVVSESFRGKSRIAQHQEVYAALGGVIADRIHALQLRTRAPDAS